VKEVNRESSIVNRQSRREKLRLFFLSSRLAIHDSLSLCSFRLSHFYGSEGARRAGSGARMSARLVARGSPAKVGARVAACGKRRRRAGVRLARMAVETGGAITYLAKFYADGNLRQ
jgi:hypothetical protein